MNNEENASKKSTSFVMQRTLLIVISVAVVSVLAVGSGILMAQNDIDAEAFKWVIMIVMVVFITFLTIFLNRRSVKTNNLREYYVLDNDGSLYYVDASQTTNNGSAAVSPIGAMISDMLNTKNGIVNIDKVLSECNIEDIARRIETIKSVKRTSSFYVINCRTSFRGNGRVPFNLHIPINVEEVDLLLNEFERIYRTQIN